MNLSPARLAVLVALVVGGVAVMMNGFADDTTAAADGSGGAASVTVTASPTGTATPTETESPAPDVEPEVDGVRIQVLNGTNTTGLAAEAEQFLVNKGYVVGGEAADAPNKPVATTTVYYRGGEDEAQAEANATNLAERYLKGVQARVRVLNAALDTVVAPRAQLVIVLGEDYADANPIG